MLVAMRLAMAGRAEQHEVPVLVRPALTAVLDVVQFKAVGVGHTTQPAAVAVSFVAPLPDCGWYIIGT